MLNPKQKYGLEFVAWAGHHEGMRWVDSFWLRWRVWGPVILLFLAIYGVWPRSGQGPMARTEGVRALTGHEIARDGCWLVPRLYGKVYLRKPPLYYWSVAVAEKVVGRAEPEVWRIPPALSAVALTMFLWAFSAHWFGAGAGVATGFAYLFLVALWSQNRSCEIDGPATAAAVMASCSLLELGFGSGSRRWLWVLFGGLSLGATLLYKGPAPLPVVLGAILGSSWAVRKWSWLKKPGPWLVILGGCGLFAWWGMAVWRALAQLKTVDASGFEEIAQRISPLYGWRDWPQVLSLPLLVVLYAFPVSGAWWLCRGYQGSVQTRERIRAIGGTVAAALLVYVLSTTSNPRYAYPVLPFFTLLCGAVAKGWYDQDLAPGMAGRGRMLLQAGTAAFALFVIDTMVSGIRYDRSAALALGPATLVTVVFSMVLMWALYRTRWRAAASAAVLMLIAGSHTFGQYLRFERFGESGYQAGLSLKKALGSDAHVLSEMVPYFHPEILWYAGVSATRPPKRFYEDFLPTGYVGWVLIHPKEWARWEPVASNHLSRIQFLEGPRPAVLAWYEETGDETTSSTTP